MSALLAIAVLLAAAPDDKKEAALVKQKADEICQLLLKGDHARFADLTYPAVVKEAGGRDKLIEKLKSAAKEMKSKGIEITAVKPSDPTASESSGDERYVIVPYEMEMKVLGSKTTVKSFLLAISGDKGKSWTFVDGAGVRDVEKRKRMLPNYPETLRLPPRER
jgi:hypothetical protein